MRGGLSTRNHTREGRAVWPASDGEKVHEPREISRTPGVVQTLVCAETGVERGRLSPERRSTSCRARSAHTSASATYLVFHEVDKVQHWLSSPKREEVFGPMGITLRTFHDPEGSNRVGLLAEIPDFAAFQEFMQSEAAAEAMKHDGVRPETLVFLTEA